MTLGQKQQIFAVLVADLIQHAVASGYAVRLGEAYRSPEEAQRLATLGKGIVNSQHCQKLAIDLNLFKDGKYLTASEDHKPLGEYWELQSGDEYQCRWGGRFARRDGNHYEIV